MNERIEQLAEQCWVHTNEPLFGGKSPHWEFDREKFAELIVRECNKAVLEVPCYYKDYRAQIEEAVINDCARAVLEHFGVKE